MENVVYLIVILILLERILPSRGGEGMDEIIYLIIILILIERILHTGYKKR
mgnify:CR=1 FL=1